MEKARLRLKMTWIKVTDRRHRHGCNLYYSPKRECKIKECMRNGIQRLRLGSDLFGKPYSGAAHVLAVNNSLVLPSGAIFLLEKIWAFNFTHQFKRNRQ
jgi:hypothetical protein